MYIHYKMKKIIEESESAKHYTAVNGEGCLFLVSEFYGRDIINRYLPCVAAISQKNTAEFVQWFSENSALFVVFKYAEGVPLTAFLEREALAFEYRLFMAKSIASHSGELESAPFIVQRAAICPENIVIYEGNILFNCKMDLQYMEESEGNVFPYISELLGELFTHKELTKNIGLKIISEKCRKGIYESFGELVKDLDDLLKEEEKQPDLKAAIIMKNKQRISKIRNALIVLAILASFAIFYQSVMQSERSVPAYAPIKEIGGVAVWDASSEGVDAIQGEVQAETIYIYEKNNTTGDEAAKSESITPEQDKQIQETPQTDDAEEQAKDERQANGHVYEDTPYIVKKGDTLTSICRDYYGNTDALPNLKRYIGLNNPDIIYPGQRLMLPPPELLEESP